jgi:Flagellar assembly protein T, C-terminal domain
VDTDRIGIDLTARDGVQPGSVVSLRRDTIPIVHPVTGEMLGELDQELATGKVTEVREKFSVVEIQSVSPGAEVKVKDRATVR